MKRLENQRGLHYNPLCIIIEKSGLFNTMREIRVCATSEYRVLIASGLLRELGRYAADTVRGRKALLVTGSEVQSLYGTEAEESLRRAGFEVFGFVYPAGEPSKNFAVLSELLECAARNELERGDVFIALGGGVTGDLTGLASALYKRGVACIQVPTTLLAMADSSVGGKTAVNLSAGKNLAGIIKQPALVLCDPELLSTLPERIAKEGWAEIIKYAFLDEKIHALVSGGADMEDIISACLTYKSALIQEDEFDAGPRRLLNFGHTVGHALEWCSDYELLHGEAVAVGMCVMTRGCEALNLCPSGLSAELERLLQRHGLPTRCACGAPELMKAAKEDKKRDCDGISLVVPERIGKCRIEKHSFDTLEKIIYAGL